jgi:type IV pilus assembly protein PilM
MFAKPKRSVGIDLGAHTIKIVELVMSAGRPAVNRAVKIQLNPVQMLSDPTTAQVTGLREGLAEFDTTGAVYVAALSGQSVVIRYPRLPMMPDEEIPGAIEIEAAQNIPYEMQEIVMDSVKLEEVTEDGQTMFKVLLVAARRELVHGRLSILQEAGIHPHVLGIDSLALTDATALSGALPTDESVALINVGATTTNIHFCRDGMSSFIRDISWGTREINTAIQRAYKLEADGAEQMIELAGRRPTMPPPSDASLGRAPAESPLEPLPERAAGEVAGPLEPLPEEGFGSESAGVQPGVDEQMMSAVRPAVMRLVGEIRRSFDYYEQQLYERSVKQIILSGGGAEFPPLREIVAEELNVAALQVANPIGDQILVVDEESARDMLDHPAQFVVAVGLAGRGIEWL